MAVRVVIASSLDGFIAGPNDEIDWLDGHQGAEDRFTPFYAGVGPCVARKRYVMTRSAWLLVAALAVVALPPPRLAAESTGVTDPEDTVRQVFLTWSDHDVERLDALFAEDGVYEDVPPNKVYRGTEEIKGFMAAIWSWAPDIRLTPTSMVSLGDTVVAEWTMAGTQTGPIGGIPASGESFSVRGASVVEFEDGKIVRHSDYYDLVTLVVHFGVRFAAPPAPSQPED